MKCSIHALNSIVLILASLLNGIPFIKSGMIIRIITKRRNEFIWTVVYVLKCSTLKMQRTKSNNNSIFFLVLNWFFLKKKNEMCFLMVLLFVLSLRTENKGTHKSISNQEKEILNEKKDLRFDRFFTCSTNETEKK